MKINLQLLVVSLFFTSQNLSLHAQADNFKLLKTFHISSPGGWDYVHINGNNLYVSHGNQVNILNKETGDSLGIIPSTIGVHGVATIEQINKGYTSNGKTNNVSVFELSTYKVISIIKTGENPDAIFYDTFSKYIITCNGKSKDLSVIDPLKDSVLATIPVGGKPETAVSDNAGNIYVNIEDQNEIVKIDIKTKKVTAHWSLSPSEEPTGLAIDQKSKRLFAGTTNDLVVMNAENGKIIERLPIGKGCDGVVFDKSLQHIFTANGEGTMTIIKQISPDKYSLLKTINTKRGARTIGIDENNHNVYLPTADFETQPPGDVSRPKMIPGTFQILVYTSN